MFEQGLESDIAQHLLPGALPGEEQDQPLAGNAARLSSKVAKAEARRGLAPAPDSAFNFRPAVRCCLSCFARPRIRKNFNTAPSLPADEGLLFITADWAGSLT